MGEEKRRDDDDPFVTEGIKKLKNSTYTMRQKRRKKRKLKSYPNISEFFGIEGIAKREFNRWKRWKWSAGRNLKKLRRNWIHDLTFFTIFRNSLRKIELRCGTSIVNVFLFIRWTFLLNLFISVVVCLCIILPFLFSNVDSGKEKIPNACSVQGYQFKKHPLVENINAPPDINITVKSERLSCCVKHYYEKAVLDLRGSSISALSVVLTRAIWGASGTQSLEHTMFYYGYYIVPEHQNESRWFPAMYVLVVAFVLFVSLILMVRSVGFGIEDLIMSTEGEHNPFSNLILCGWEHSTRDAQSAAFKRRILRHQMLIELGAEKHSLETFIRSKKERIKLGFIRFFINIVVIGLLVAAAVSIHYLVNWTFEKKSEKNRQTEISKISQEDLAMNFAIGLLPSLLISILNVIFPLILSKVSEMELEGNDGKRQPAVSLGRPEKYSPQIATAFVLFRSLLIRLFSIMAALRSLNKFSYCKPMDDEDFESETFSDLNEIGIEKGVPVYHCVTCEDPSKTPSGRQTACWENLIADQIYKLIMVDLLLKIVITFMIEPFRCALKRHFKHPILRRIGTIRFSIVRHSLDIIFMQVLSWLGIYYGPFIPIVCTIYFALVFYIKKFSVLHNCNEVPDTSKIRKTTMTFVAAKLMAFVFVAFVNAYNLGYLVPSRGCGPFRTFNKPWGAVASLISGSPLIYSVYGKLNSVALTAPLSIVLSLMGYYYYSVAQANKAMVENLRHLLVLEGHDKQFLFNRLKKVRGPRPSRSTSRTQFSSKASSKESR